MSRALSGALALVVILALCASAHAQPSYTDVINADGVKSGTAVVMSEIGDCVPHPIAGTVPYLNAFEAQDTNAQLFGAVGFFERVMMGPSNLGRFGVDVDKDPDEPMPRPFWGWEINVLPNIVRVPSVNLGSGCGYDLRYAMQGVNLYSANSSLRFPLVDFKLGDQRGSVGLFYAGGVTATVIQNSNPFFQTYKFAAMGLLGTYVPPAVLLFNDDENFQQVIGDFILGTEVSLGDWSDFYLGYAWSQGLYTNLSSRKLRYFASAILRAELDQIPLLQTGFRAVETIEGIGTSSLWGRRQQLLTGSALQASAADALDDLRLTTGNFAQEAIPLGDFIRLDLEASYAFEPEPFLHRFKGALYNPEFAQGLFGLKLEVGIIDFPDRPYLGVEGGRRWTVIADTGIVRLGYNDPNFFEAFPYARDFLNVNVKFAF